MRVRRQYAVIRKSARITHYDFVESLELNEEVIDVISG